MNISLAELISSIPSEYSILGRSATGRTYKCKDTLIDIGWWENGNPRFLSYFKGDNRHRSSFDGPAEMSWHKNGAPYEIVYWKEGLIHRPSAEGPAYIAWRENGAILLSEYWEHGLRLKSTFK